MLCVYTGNCLKTAVWKNAMPLKISFTSFVAFALLAGCVTINVYFPAAAAQKAADKIIDDVWGSQGQPDTAPQATPSQSRLNWPRLGLSLLNFVVPAAHAADTPNIDINAPAVRNIVASMEARFPQLKPYYDSGAIGLTQNATISVINMGTVSLVKRNQLKQLVADENADRNALYREIAVANGHPEWESQIRATFAERWISKAQSGWSYQQGDQWREKK